MTDGNSDHNEVIQRQVQYVVVYIEEAHAADRWRMGQPRNVLHATTVAERAKSCREMTEELGLRVPCWVDSISQSCGRPEHYDRCGTANFERLYAAWPLRRLILDHDGTILHRGDSDTPEFVIDDEDDLILSLLQVRAA